MLPALLIGGLGSDLDERRADLARTVGLLARAADRKPVEPSQGLSQQLEFLLTSAGSASSSQMTSILCGDVAERRGVGSSWRAVEKSRERCPLAGPLANDITPCEFWDPPAEAPTVLDNDVPALLLAATGDPRTLYSGARAMRERWPNSRLLTVEHARQLLGDAGGDTVGDLHRGGQDRTLTVPFSRDMDKDRWNAK
ncbi:alpha/beta hydrolase [Streptomyces griseoruber]